MNSLFESGIIEEFSGDYRFLSNFWPCEIKYKGFTFPSTEHAYQAVKWFYVSNTDHPEELILDFLGKATTAGKAKRMGRLIPLDAEIWDRVKVQVMREITTIKYSDNIVLRELLKSTNPMYIQEGNNWGDTFWGVDLKTGLGKNVLGRILMNERLSIV
jgi:ribA/ribD-fused uncharacterized protein